MRLTIFMLLASCFCFSRECRYICEMRIFITGEMQFPPRGKNQINRRNPLIHTLKWIAQCRYVKIVATNRHFEDQKLYNLISMKRHERAIRFNGHLQQIATTLLVFVCLLYYELYTKNTVQFSLKRRYFSGSLRQGLSCRPISREKRAAENDCCFFQKNQVISSGVCTVSE